MTADKTYKINDLRAISETLEGETIIINLETGNYYSMNKTGTVVWNQIGLQRPLSEIVNTLFTQYNAAPDVIEKSLLTIIELLEKDDLIVATDAGKGSEASVGLAEAQPKNPKEKFVAPSIEKYQDMQEMLLADPIHDVDEMGWPKLKQN